MLRNTKPCYRGVAATVICLIILVSVGVKAADAAFVAYVTNSGSANVSVIDTATKAVLATISVGLTPEQIAVTPNSLYAYVANSGSNNVSVIDTASNTVVGSPIPVGERPDFLAVSSDGGSVYVPNQISNTVSVIATATNSVVGSPIPVDTAPTGVAFGPSTSPGIPTLSDGALILLVGAMTAALALRITGRPIVSRLRRPPTI